MENTKAIVEAMKKVGSGIVKSSWVQGLIIQAAEKPCNKVPEYVSKSEDVLQAEPVKKYAEAVERLHNEGEDLQLLEKYKECVKKMLLSQK